MMNSLDKLSYLFNYNTTLKKRLASSTALQCVQNDSSNLLCSVYVFTALFTLLPYSVHTFYITL